jgi:hypothetical protein
MHTIELKLLGQHPQGGFLLTINRQNVFRRHVGLEQVGRAKNVTASGLEQFAVAANFGGQCVGRSGPQQLRDRDSWQVALQHFQKCVSRNDLHIAKLAQWQQVLFVTGHDAICVGSDCAF